MGTDFAASASFAHSATSGANLMHNEKFGDFFVGGGSSKSTLPAWLLPVLVVGAVLVATVFLIRR